MLPTAVRGRRCLRRVERLAALEVIRSSGRALCAQLARILLEELSPDRRLAVGERSIVQAIAIRAAGLVPDAADLGEAQLQIEVLGALEVLTLSTQGAQDLGSCRECAQGGADVPPQQLLCDLLGVSVIRPEIGHAAPRRRHRRERSAHGPVLRVRLEETKLPRDPSLRIAVVRIALHEDFAVGGSKADVPSGGYPSLLPCQQADPRISDR